MASSVLKDKYESRGYKVIDLPPPKEYKDYNDWIKSLRTKKTITMEKYRKKYHRINKRKKTLM